MVVIHTHWVFPLTHWHSHALTSIQGVFPLTHWHSCALNVCSGGVQYSLIGIQVHSQTFRACSVLTQMSSFSWSHHSESCSIMTQWWLCVLIGCSHSLNGAHAHSMDAQGLFLLTHWCSCTLNGCSEAVQYSLIGIHMHSQAFRGYSILTQRHSAGLST